MNPNKTNNQNSKPSQAHQPGDNFQPRNQNTSGGSGPASQPSNSVSLGGVANHSGSSATSNRDGRSLWSWLGLGLAALLLLGGAWAGRGILANLFGGQEGPTTQEVSDRLDELPLATTEQGQLKINDDALLDGYLQFEPIGHSPDESGQLFVNQQNQLIYFDGDQTYNLSQQPTTINATGGELTTGQGLVLNEGTLTNTGVLSLLGSEGIVVSGSSDLTLDLSDQVSLLGQTIANNELANSSLSYAAGDGLSGGGNVALGESGNFRINPGSGLQITSDKVALGPLTSNWNQTGAFDVVLNNSDSELSILGSGGNFLGTIDVNALSQASTYNLPDPTAASDIVCLVNLGNCAGTGSGVTSTGGGTANRIAKFTTSQNIENSSLLDDGVTVSIDDGVNLNVDSGSLFVDSASNRVGIGTTSPSVALDVSGQGTFTGVVSGANAVNNNEFVTLGQLNDGTSTNAFVQGGNSFGALATLGTNDANALVLETGGTERVRIDTSGNVGLGTTSPGSKFEVNTGTDTNKGIIVRGTASQTANLQEWYNPGGSVKLAVDNNGRLEVEGGRLKIGNYGSGNPEFNHNNDTLVVRQGGGRFQFYGTSAEVAVTDLDGANIITMEQRPTGNNGLITVRGNDYSSIDKPNLVLRPWSSQTADMLQFQNSSGTVLSTIDSSGNLGIGTTSPAEGLTLGSDGNTKNLLLSRENTATSTTQYPSNDVILQSSVWDTTNSVAENRTISLRNIAGSGSNAFEPYRLGILNNGGTEFATFEGDTQRVGVGIANPETRLHVVGGNGIRLGTGIHPSQSDSLKVGTSGYQFGHNDSYEVIGLFTNNDNEAVGFRHTTSQFELHTNATRRLYVDRSTGAFRFSDGSAASPILSFMSDTDTGLYRPGVNVLGLTTGGSERLRIDSAGNVGIGTPSPSELLHVNGNALVDGQLTVNGNSTFNGTFTVNGHIISGNSSGTTSATAGAAACTSPTVSVSGNDTAGTITVTTGTGCSGGGVLATVTFANAYGAAPKVTLTPGNANAAGLDYFRGSTTTDFTLETATTPTDSTTYTYDYQVIQ